MHIVHTADTHLGYSAYQRLVVEGEPYAGLNQREVDVYTAWHALIDATLEADPDLFLHAGDLFDSVRPSNRALHEAITGLRRLTKANIPAVLIAGNHETPRLRETGHVFRLLENFEGLYPIFKGPPEAIIIPGLDHTRLVGVPHHHHEMEQSIAQAFPDEQYKNNLLMLHGTVTGLELPSKELNQAQISSGLLRPGWDYIALGHYHCFTQVEPNTYYSGSTERFSFAEAGQPKGFAVVELPGLKVTHRELEVREFVDLPWIDLAQLQRLKSAERVISDHSLERPSDPLSQTPDTLPAEVSAPATQLTFNEFVGSAEPASTESEEQLAPTIEPAQVNLNALLQEALKQCRPTGKVIRQKVLNCPTELYRLVDHQALRKLTAGAVHYMPLFELALLGEALSSPTVAIGALEEEFATYLARQPLEGFDRDRLEALGKEFMANLRAGP